MNFSARETHRQKHNVQAFYLALSPTSRVKNSAATLYIYVCMSEQSQSTQSQAVSLFSNEAANEAPDLLLKLTSLTPHTAPNVRITRSKKVWTFGRAPQCDVILPGKRVSGVHFVIFESDAALNQSLRSNEAIIVAEDRSQNGLYVNGRRVSRNGGQFGRQILAHGDEIALALGLPENEIRRIYAYSLYG